MQKSIFLGLLMILYWGMIALSGVEGKEDSGLKDSMKSKSISGSLPKMINRAAQSRDPFLPLTPPKQASKPKVKPNPKPKPSNMSRVSQKAIFTKSASQWRLLAVIHGQFGGLAVIKLSGNKRVFVHEGAELGGSGWYVSKIDDSQVILEHPEMARSQRKSSKPGSYILTFPAVTPS